MDPLLLMVLALNVVLLILVGALALRKPPATTDVPALESKIILAVNDRLLGFQNSITETVQGTRKEVEESKGAVEKSALEMHKHLTQLGKTIEGLKQQNVGAQDLARDLKTMLQAPKLRGSHGERILEEMLERLLPEGMWDRQVNIEGREAVDAVVQFKDVMFPIDAKFPRDDYERYHEAGTDAERATAWKGFEAAIKTQINSISSKYVKPDRGTADFALMFVPSEAIYYETISEKNGLGSPNPLLEYAQDRHVIPVGPNTLYAFLQVIMIATDQIRLAQNTKKLQEGLAKVELSFDRFYDRFEDIGQALAKAAQAYGTGEGHIRRYHDRLRSVLALDSAPENEEDDNA